MRELGSLVRREDAVDSLTSMAASRRKAVAGRTRRLVGAMVAIAITLSFVGCTPSGGTQSLPAPPGLVVGTRLSDIRMFAFDRQSRITLVDGTVVDIAWPWVLVGSRGAGGGARLWMNFSHVCSFHIDK